MFCCSSASEASVGLPCCSLLLASRDVALLERGEVSSRLAAQQEEAVAAERQLATAARQVRGNGLCRYPAGFL
jgi:hypothetical protein